MRRASCERGASFVTLLILIAVLGGAVLLASTVLGGYLRTDSDQSGAAVPILGDLGRPPEVPRAAMSGLTPAERFMSEIVAETESRAGRSMPIGAVTEERFSPGIVIQGTRAFRDLVRRDLQRLASTATGRTLLAALDANRQNLGTSTTIQYGGAGDFAYGAASAQAYEAIRTGATVPDLHARGRVNASGQVEITQPGQPDSSIVSYNPRPPGRWGGQGLPSCMPPVLALGHELTHALRLGRGESLRLDSSWYRGRYINLEEQVAVGLRDLAHGPQVSENRLRLELGRGGKPGLGPRTDYSGSDVCVAGR